jgi:hypothetical protein
VSFSIVIKSDFAFKHRRLPSNWDDLQELDQHVFFFAHTTTTNFLSLLAGA